MLISFQFAGENCKFIRVTFRKLNQSEIEKK